MAKHKIPAQFNLCGGSDAFELDIEAAAPGEQKKSRKFEMTAYGGGQMMIRGFYYPVVVDLSGLDISQKSKPIFLEHEQRIDHLLGQTDSITVRGGQLKASGKILSSGEIAQEVLKLNDAGYQWQASIGARIDEFDFVTEKQKVTVNGQTFKGPLYHISKSTLGEISFVMLGADESTSASIAAKAMKGIKTMFGKKKQEQVQEVELQDNHENAELVASLNWEADILEACQGHPRIAAKAIEEKWTVDKAKLEVIRASRQQTPNANISGNGNNSREVLQCAAMRLMGYGENAERIFGEQVLEAASRINNHVELSNQINLANGMLDSKGTVGTCQAALEPQRHGIQASSFSTESLPNIIGSSMDKLMVDLIENTNQDYRLFCKIRHLNSFRTHDVLRLDAKTKLEKIGPDGEVKHSDLDETSFNQLKADTYALMIRLTVQSFVNDGLGALDGLPDKFIRGAFSSLNDLIYQTLLDNTGSHFHEDNGNYASGAGTALSVDSLTAAFILFLNQTNERGYPADVHPKVLLVSAANGLLAKQLLKSAQLQRYVTNGTDNQPMGNPFGGDDLKLVVQPRLNNSKFTNYSSTAWYLLGGPNDAPMNVGFINGIAQPSIEYFSPSSQAEILAHTWRCVFDYGASLGQPESGVFMAGA